MSKIKGGVKNPRVKMRRQRALERAKSQLKSGVKQPKGTVMALDKVPLTDSDKKRLEKEILTLESRL